jgi:Domain of unknown function (DUF4160)
LSNGKKKNLAMPQISAFFGILIYMYYDDHNPPHFHAKYGESEAVIGINDFALLEGRLPSKTLGLVIEWASSHQKELLKDWELAKKKEKLLKIEPLA